MRISRFLPLALAVPLLATTASAQGSGGNVTVLRMTGPHLGVRLSEVGRDDVTRLKLREEKGALVREVLKDSPAEKAGLLEDDVIVRFQGESILTAAQLTRLVREVPGGRKVDIEVVRNGAPVKVAATIERRDGSAGDFDEDDWRDWSERLSERFEKMELPKLAIKPRVKVEPRVFRFDEDGLNWAGFGFTNRGRLGITYSEIEGQLANYFKAPAETAILVNSVLEESPAAKAGLRAGDLLVRIGGASIADASDLRDAVSDLEEGKSAPMTVVREGRNVELSVTLEPKKRERLLKKKSVS